jgi:hypothetical protein
MLFKIKIDYNNKLSSQLLAGEQQEVEKAFFTFWHAVGEHGVENS